MNATAKHMIWISGYNVTGRPGIYGTQGIPDPSNIPGARMESISWIDSSDNLYLFGGGGYSTSDTTGRLNDLWKFDGKHWTWISGSAELDQKGVYNTQGTPDPSNISGGRRNSMSWIDSFDNMYLFGGNGKGESEYGRLNDLWKFDGKNWTWISGSKKPEQHGSYGQLGVPHPTNVPCARYGSVTWIDSENNLYLFGGNGHLSGKLNDLWKFDGKNWTWIAGSSGYDTPGQYGDKGVTDSDNYPGARYGAVSWIDSSNNLYLFGGKGVSRSGTGYLNDLWKFDGTYWTWISGSDGVNEIGHYGSKGDPNNVPGARMRPVSWIDSKNNLYLFGGEGYAITLDKGLLSDLWKYDGSKWTWIGGSEITNKPGNYGTQGVADSKNYPGARYYAVSWTDSSNNLYLFGGNGYDAQIHLGLLNDLWVFVSDCFGVLSNDPQVCSGRGKCVDENDCECTGAIGANCETPLCFEIPANDPNVCSHHGTCTTTDQCECKENWFGAKCDITKCFDILGNDSSVCNGNGKCVDHNVCECESGWRGSDCSEKIPSCFGKKADNTSVCSGRGSCVAQDICECNDKWFGEQCDIPTCYGKKGNETSVCSGRGICTDIDKCKCNPRYMGNDCAKDRLIIVHYATANIPSWNWLCLLVFLFVMLNCL